MATTLVALLANVYMYINTSGLDLIISRCSQKAILDTNVTHFLPSVNNKTEQGCSTSVPQWHSG